VPDDVTWRRTTLRVPGMDCPTEEQLVRMALAELPAVAELEFDLADRRLTVVHRSPADRVLAALAPLGFGARVEASEPTTPLPPPTPGHGEDAAARERRVLLAVLAINAAMFVVELAAGLWAQSTGLVADSLDMLADASVYAIALLAVGGAHASQRRSARVSGWLQLALAGLVLVEVARRATQGSEPISGTMVAVGLLALAANLTCVVLLSRYRTGGVHLRASWIFTTNDALANAGVIAAGILVAVTGSALPDLLIGTAIAVLVASGALRILRMSR
jgi:Co/Zn/Cd efflux system component/copper chaperone CopZ